MEQRRHQAKDDERLVLSKRNMRLVLAIAVLFSLFAIIIGTIFSQDSKTWRIIVKIGLIQFGTTILISSTIGIVFTEAYRKLRELTIQDEILSMVDIMRELVARPEEFEKFRLLSYMEQAKLLAFYPNRLGPAQDDLRLSLEGLLEVDKPTTVYFFGVTLRVCFGAEGPFTLALHRVLSQNPNVKLKVLLLNPNCRSALYRSEAETIGKPFENDMQYRKAALYQDSMVSSECIERWNARLTVQSKRDIPIEIKYYDCADYCLAVIFPDVCYTSQYLYADAEAQVQTPGIPMLKYSGDSVTY